MNDKLQIEIKDNHLIVDFGVWHDKITNALNEIYREKEEIKTLTKEFRTSGELRALYDSVYANLKEDVLAEVKALKEKIEFLEIRLNWIKDIKDQNGRHDCPHNKLYRNLNDEYECDDCNFSCPATSLNL